MPFGTRVVNTDIKIGAVGILEVGKDNVKSIGALTELLICK